MGFDFEKFRERARGKQAPKSPPSLDIIKRRLNPAAFESYQSTIKLWKGYKTAAHGESTTEEVFTEPQVFTKPPDVNDITCFLEWLAWTRKGTLEENITNVTVRNRLASLKRAIKIHTQYQYSQDQNKDIDNFIKEVLIGDDRISTAVRPKPRAPKSVAVDIIEFLFACDEYKELHQRMRNQMAFTIQLLLLLGARPGEVVESDAWHQSNEGLLYKDVQLIYQRTESYLGWVLHIKLRNRKGQRGFKKTPPTMILYEEPLLRCLCPVTWFLSLAFADRVFKDLSSPNDLRRVTPPPGTYLARVQYVDSALERPVLRGMNPDGSVSEERIWTYDCFNAALKGVGLRAQFGDNLSAYCFRRAFAHTVLKNAGGVHVQAALGHKNLETAQFYVSDVFEMDVQGLVMGREQNLGMFEESTSMMASRNLQAPRPPGSSLAEPSIMRAKQLIEALDDRDRDVIATKQLTKAQVAQFRRKGRDRNFKASHKAFLERPHLLLPDSQNDLDSQDSEVLPNAIRTPSRYFIAKLKFEPERKVIIDMMFSNEQASDIHLTFAGMLPPLIKLANPARKRYAYRTAQPTAENSCPDCGIRAVKFQKIDRFHTHLLQCARLRRQKKARDQEINRLQQQRVCLWSDCTHQFKSDIEQSEMTPKCFKKHLQHVTKHLEVSKARQCLWRVFKEENGRLSWEPCYLSNKERFANPQDLALHIAQEHRIPSMWTSQTSMHYCYEHDAWCHSDRMWDAHLHNSHLQRLNGFCGMIKERGVVIVAGHCLFCLGSHAPLSERFMQFHDVYDFHTHVIRHVAKEQFPKACPHPQCKTALASQSDFWDHAGTVHGMPSFGPRRTTGKRKTPEGGLDEVGLGGGSARRREMGHSCEASA